MNLQLIPLQVKFYQVRLQVHLHSIPNCVYCGNKLQPFEVKENQNDDLPENMARPICYVCWDQIENHEVKKEPVYDWENTKPFFATIIT